MSRKGNTALLQNPVKCRAVLLIQMPQESRKHKNTTEALSYHEDGIKRSVEKKVLTIIRAY